MVKSFDDFRVTVYAIISMVLLRGFDTVELTAEETSKNMNGK